MFILEIVGFLGVFIRKLERVRESLKKRERKKRKKEDAGFRLSFK